MTDSRVLLVTGPGCCMGGNSILQLYGLFIIVQTLTANLVVNAGWQQHNF